MGGAGGGTSDLSRRVIIDDQSVAELASLYSPAIDVSAVASDGGDLPVHGADAPNMATRQKNVKEGRASRATAPLAPTSPRPTLKRSLNSNMKKDICCNNTAGLRRPFLPVCTPRCSLRAAGEAHIRSKVMRSKLDKLGNRTDNCSSSSSTLRIGGVSLRFVYIIILCGAATRRWPGGFVRAFISAGPTIRRADENNHFKFAGSAAARRSFRRAILKSSSADDSHLVERIYELAGREFDIGKPAVLSKVGKFYRSHWLYFCIFGQSFKV